MESKDRTRMLRAVQSVEIAAPIERVYERWSRYEDLPRLTRSVRRVKCIDEREILWDVDVAGRQLLWEARVLENVPPKLIRWESRSGAFHRGQVRFEEPERGRTRMSVEIEYRPRDLLEHVGARLGLLDRHLGRDLELFRHAMEIPGANGRSD